MKAIMVTYDSLNRRFLSPYGCDWVQTPNFERLAEKCAVFDTLLCGQHALHAGQTGAAHGAVQFSPSLLGTDGAL